MDFEHSPRTMELVGQLTEFMDAHVYPVEEALLEGSISQPQWTSPIPGKASS